MEFMVTTAQDKLRNDHLERRLEELLDKMIRYKCVSREVEISHWRVEQTICDVMYQADVEPVNYITLTSSFNM